VRLKLAQKLRSGTLHAIYTNAEDFRVATIVTRTILALLAAFAAVSAIAFFSGDTTLVIIMLIGGFLLTLPSYLLFSGRLRMCCVVLLVLVVLTMTISAVMGQGIHDIAILAFPIAIFYANLVLKRSDFVWISALILAALIYIGLGETYGWYLTKPFQESPAVDLFIAIIIVLVAIMIADSLAENIRKSMELAQKEIALREKAQTELRHLNIHDPLTGIYNRSFFDEMVILLEKRKEYPASIIFADIDDLKAVNDNYGHATGDDLLQRTALLLSQTFRDEDILARIGGDEFAVILPQSDEETAKMVCERMCETLRAYNEMNPDKPIHISHGFSTCKTGGLKQAVMDADQRMYENKAARKSM
jgi:diguanylate cyclase (GGDEF)-like protein